MYNKIKFLGSTVHIFEFNQVKHSFKLDFGTTKKLEPLSKLAIGALAKINCGFFNFDASSEHLGTWSPNWTTVAYDDNGDQLLKFYDPEIMSLADTSKIKTENTLIFGAGYTLVEDGKASIRNFEPFPHYKSRNPRTMLAQKQNRNIMFIVVEGRLKGERGMTAKEQAQLCLQLDARCAVNFDGGGSSEMIVGKTIVNKPTDGRERAIGSCLAVYKK